ncbi:hypothetical protein IPJ72_05765 [Candidatus Peregrinibacteria bacterium]|nr:MAG: hypothetical protein IPJ72_05765 [Candidatus Peregrinibacteria bacterium]
MKTCKNCQSPFEVTESDRAFYDKVSPLIAGKKYLIPEPTLCPVCRQIRRLAWRNEHYLYRRKCDKTGDSIVSIFPPTSLVKVYKKEAWWSDEWDALDYGRAFDFSRSFFEQMNELKQQVPHLSLQATNNENSEYTHLETDSKNCYMNFGGHYNENCYYNLHALKSDHCIDNYWVDQCSYCYECFQCFHSRNLFILDGVFIATTVGFRRLPQLFRLFWVLWITQ